MLAVMCAPAGATENRQAGIVVRVLFGVCEEIIVRNAELWNHPELGGLGFRRTPRALEERLRGTADQAPVIVRRGEGAEMITVLHYPSLSACAVMFGGSRRHDTLQAIRTHLAGLPGLAPDTSAPMPAGPLAIDSYRFRLGSELSHRLTIAHGPDTDRDPVTIATIYFSRD
ncbi:hypothetical protein RCO27_13710 [Sphingosinicella sp. LHD-64]|uniref:hypothetical protein n=1 Tax=Sphingosinicella sp. LHD-64 TaxID=3072139 RepID=UPI00280F6831|nr:hypothetical protein [Sphingosinicella sp. LHD-64]MDQ8757282.1 hypothetical protein [Sphingosinicella sp. LHD-64]